MSDFENDGGAGRGVEDQQRDLPPLEEATGMYISIHVAVKASIRVSQKSRPLDFV